jgi:hypothetical protein
VLKSRDVFRIREWLNGPMEVDSQEPTSLRLQLPVGLVGLIFTALKIYFLFLIYLKTNKFHKSAYKLSEDFVTP